MATLNGCERSWHQTSGQGLATTKERNIHQKGITVQVLLADLKASSRTRDLQRGKKIHANAVECGHDSNNYVSNSLIYMYAKCGSILDARRVFDTMLNPNVVSWTSLILGYAENGEGLVALDLFSRMKSRGCAPNSVTYVAALKACTALAVEGDGRQKANCLEQGRCIHSEIGSNLNDHMQSKLIDMYAKCGSMVDARRVFDIEQNPNVVCWNALLVGYAENGEGLVALDFFAKMKPSGRPPNSVTYVAALKACTSLAIGGDGRGKTNCLELGREIHAEIGSHLNQYVQNMLIDMYAKCDSMVEAREVFDSMQYPDVVSWNALLLGYAEIGKGLAALDLFTRMKASGCAPDAVTYLAALKACTSLAVDGDVIEKANCLRRGREIHLEIGSQLNRYVQSALLVMYAKCGSMVDAHCVFDSMLKPDVVSWSALLSGYAENGEALVALDLFSRMKASGCAADVVTYLAALKCCGLIGALALGRKLHSEIPAFDPHVVTCLIDFYAKCGSMVEAHEVFGLHPKARDITTWNALLAGYGRLGDSDSLFNLFEAMHDEGFWPDHVTFVCMLLCCSHAGLVEKAREYFKEMDVRYGVTPTVMHYNCMVDVFGRANRLNEAIALLQKMSCTPNLVTWKTLLGACRKWKNVEIGTMAFHSLMAMDEKDTSAYILMAHIYGSKAMMKKRRRPLAEDKLMAQIFQA